jgi:uncharacterized membrane protein YheB (UPF0754 family)
MNTEWTNLLIQGLAGGITGYVTNNYALNMLFHEYTPLKLGGVIKKTKTEFIAAISELVEKDLLSPSHLKSEILKDESLEEWNHLFASLWDEFFQAEFQKKPIQEIPGVQKALPIWINSLVEDGLHPLQNGSLSIPKTKLGSLLSKGAFSFLFKRLITQSIAEAQQGNMLDSFVVSLTSPLNEKSLSDFLSTDELETLENTLQGILAKGTSAIQEDPSLLTTALAQLSDSEEIPALLAHWEAAWGNQPLSARLLPEQRDEWANLLHRLLIFNLEPNALDELATQIRESLASSALLNQPITGWFEEETQGSMENFFHISYENAFDQFQGFLAAHEDDLRERLKRAAQTELNQQSGMLASMIQGPLFSYLDKMKIPELVEGFRAAGETQIKDYLSTHPVSDWMPMPSQKAVVSILQAGLIGIDEQLEDLIGKGLKKTPIQLLGSNWATRYNQKGKYKLVELASAIGIEKLSDQEAQDRFLSTTLRRLTDQPWSEEACLKLLSAMKKLNLQPVQQAIISLDDNLYETIKEKSIPSEIWQSILKNPNLQASLEKQGIDLMDRQIQQPLDHFLSRFNQLESRDAFGNRLIGMIESHGETFLEGKVQELVKTNLQSRDEEEIVELAHDFIGRELQPITKFGFLLGVIAGIAMALFPLPRTLMIGPVDLFPIGVFACVGVITNWIALQMIFKPYKEIRWLKRIPFFRHFAHGYLMKNQRVFAENLAQFVDESLLNRNMIQQLFSDQKKNLKQRWMDWLPTRISSWLQSGVEKGHGELASAFTNQIQTTLTAHAADWSTSITESLRERPIPLDNKNLQLWFEDNGTPLIQKGWSKWRETHRDEPLSSLISPEVISATLQPLLQKQVGAFPVHLLWENSEQILEHILVSQLTLKRNDCLGNFLFGIPANLLRDRQKQLISSLLVRGQNSLQDQEQTIADRLNQSVQGQLNFLQRGGFVLMGGPALLEKILHRALFVELPDFLNENADSLTHAFDPVIEDSLTRQPSADWRLTKPAEKSIGDMGKSIFHQMPSLQEALPLTEERLSDFVRALIQKEETWLVPALAQGFSTLSQPVLEPITIHDLLTILPIEGNAAILKSLSSSPDYQANIKEGWRQITHTLGRNTVIGDWIPASLMAEQLKSMLTLMGSDPAYTAIFQEMIETAIPGLTRHLGANANLMEWLSENSFDPLYRATHAHLPALLSTLSFQEHIVREVDALSPQGIHQLFLSFAGKYFLRLEIYGLFGAIFGLHPVLPALALVSEGWETIKRKQKKGVS